MKKKQELVEYEEVKKRGFFRSLLVFVIIPALFASFVFAIIFSLLGYNVVDGIKGVVAKVPFISSSNEEQTSESTSDAKKLEITNEKQQEKIAELEKSMEEKQAEIRSLEIESQRLSKELEKSNEVTETPKTTSAMKKIITSYEEMNPKQAAKIIAELPEEESVAILSKLNPEILGEILGNLDAKTAAKYTSLVTKIP